MGMRETETCSCALWFDPTPQCPRCPEKLRSVQEHCARLRTGSPNAAQARLIEGIVEGRVSRDELSEEERRSLARWEASPSSLGASGIPGEPGTRTGRDVHTRDAFPVAANTYLQREETGEPRSPGPDPSRPETTVSEEKRNWWRSGPCVYELANRVTGVVYVGSTKNVMMRWSYHVTDAFLNGSGLPIHVALRTEGVTAFDFRVLEVLNPADCLSLNDLVDREKWHIAQRVNAGKPLYNEKLTSRYGSPTDRYDSDNRYIQVRPAPGISRPGARIVTPADISPGDLADRRSSRSGTETSRPRVLVSPDLVTSPTETSKRPKAPSRVRGFTDEEVQLMRTMRLDGCTVQEVADRLDTTGYAVFPFISDLPQPVRRPKLKLTEAEIAAMRASRVRRETVGAIAAVHDVTHATVVALTRGVLPAEVSPGVGQPRALSFAQLEEARDMRTAGKTVRQIAARFAVAPSTVHRYLRMGHPDMDPGCSSSRTAIQSGTGESK